MCNVFSFARTFGENGRTFGQNGWKMADDQLLFIALRMYTLIMQSKFNSIANAGYSQTLTNYVHKRERITACLLVFFRFVALS